MSVEKARAALDAARQLDIDGAKPDAHGLPPLQLADKYGRLLDIARVQAEIAQAEELARIADAMVTFVRHEAR